MEQATHVGSYDLRLATMNTLFPSLDQVAQQLFQRSVGWTGIEIGCHEIKLAQVSKKGSQWSLSATWSIENPVPFQGEIKDLPSLQANRDQEWFGWTEAHDILDEGIAQLLSESDKLNGLFKGKYCAATLSDGMIEYREMDLPVCDPAEARAIVDSEVALEAECEPNELVSDFWKLPKSRSRTETASYAAVSLKSNTAERIALDLLRIGFDCLVMDAVPCASARAIQMMIPEETYTCIAVDLGYGPPTMTLVQNGVPVLTRSLRSCSLISVLKNIAATFEVNLADAQTLLFQSSTFDDTNALNQEGFSNPLRRAIESYLQTLSLEIKKTVQFSDRAFQSITPERIVLMGAGVKIPRIAETLERKTNLLTDFWNIPGSAERFGNQPVGNFAIAAGLSSLAWRKS